MDQRKRDAAVNRIAGYERFVPRIYRDSEGVPTIGYGLSLTDKSKEKVVWNDLNKRLSQVGLEGYEDQVRELLQKPEQIEYWSSTGNFRSDPPGGVVISGNQARSGLNTRVDDDYEALRQKVGHDASGVYHLDKLNEAQTAAVMDAYYRNSNIIGEKAQEVLRHQDEPDWQEKMRSELNDVLQRTNRARDDANVFIADPAQNYFNNAQMLQSPVQSPFDAQGGPDFWSDMKRKLQDGMSPAEPSDPVAQIDGPTPGNLLNANALPENLLNMSDYEMRKWGLR